MKRLFRLDWQLQIEFPNIYSAFLHTRPWPCVVSRQMLFVIGMSIQAATSSPIPYRIYVRTGELMIIITDHQDDDDAGKDPKIDPRFPGDRDSRQTGDNLLLQLHWPMLSHKKSSYAFYKLLPSCTPNWCSSEKISPDLNQHDTSLMLLSCCCPIWPPVGIIKFSAAMLSSPTAPFLGSPQ